MPTSSPDAVTVLLPRPLLAVPLRHPEWTLVGVAVASALATSTVFVTLGLVAWLLWPTPAAHPERMVADAPVLPAMPVDDLDDW